MMAQAEYAKRSFEKAADLAATVDPSSSCYNSAKSLLSSIKKDNDKIYQNEIEKERQEQRTRERITIAKVNAARVVIKKMEAVEKTEGGLILSGSAKEKPQQAEVLAVGPGTEDEKMELKVGDVVVFSKYGGNELKYKGEHGCARLACGQVVGGEGAVDENVIEGDAFASESVEHEVVCRPEGVLGI